MIRAEIKFGKDRNTLEMNGHAYREGSDDGAKVCAAASGIALALMGYIRNAPKDRVKSRELHQSSGNARVMAVGTELLPVFEMAAIGLMQIEQSYPDHIEVRCERCC